MARVSRDWNNVSANANVGTGAFVSGSTMLSKALDNLRGPLDRGNAIQAQNATAERDQNTGALVDAIRRGEDPEMTGAYDSGVIGDARYSYMKDERVNARAERADARAAAAAGRAASAHRLSMKTKRGEHTADANDRASFLAGDKPIVEGGQAPVETVSAFASPEMQVAAPSLDAIANEGVQVETPNEAHS